MKCMETYLLSCEQCNRKCVKEESGAVFDFDLQLFNGEKTEDPTAKKQSDARNKGQVAKSQEMNSAFIILSAFMTLKILGTYVYDQIAAYVVYILSNLFLLSEELSVEGLMHIFQGIMLVLAKTALPIMLAIMVVAVIINLYQVGINFTTEPLMPSLSKLDPISGAKKMFSKRSLVELVKSIFKIVVVGYFIVRFLMDEIGYLPQLIYADLYAALSFFTGVVFKLAFQLCGVLMVLAAFDFMYQKWQHKQTLKMSKQDIKDEMKQSEGDPFIKGKIKQKQRAMAMQRMMQEVPKADVIITNPTHFAVALKYEKGMTAPVVIAKGQDLIAQRIKAIAKEARVVIVENKPLARALYSTTGVGDIVPQELYKSVAEVLAYVYRLKKKLS